MIFIQFSFYIFVISAKKYMIFYYTILQNKKIYFILIKLIKATYLKQNFLIKNLIIAIYPMKLSLFFKF